MAVPEEEADGPGGEGGVPGEGVALRSDGAGVLTLSHSQAVSHLPYCTVGHYDTRYSDCMVS